MIKLLIVVFNTWKKQRVFLKQKFLSLFFVKSGQSVTSSHKQNCKQIESLLNTLYLAHLSQRLKGELIVYRSSRRPSVRASVFKLSNMNISETNGLIATKFYLKHHCEGGLAA